MSVDQSPAPISQQERILVLDGLRGFALLGILLLNIPWFGIFGDPMVLNEIGTPDFTVWYVIDWLPEGTQRALFSLLFGAGILIFMSRAEKRAEGIVPAIVLIRRNLWLLLFGLVNAFILLWPGDILYQYAMCAFIILPFIRLKPVHLIIAGSVCMLIVTIRENRDLYLRKDMIRRGETIAAIDTTATKLTEEQKEELGAMTGFRDGQKLESRKKKYEQTIGALTGTFTRLYERRANASVHMETVKTYYYVFFDALVFIFFGMAFFKLGILQGEHPARTYWLMALVGLGIGLPLSYVRLEQLIHYEFNMFELEKNISFQMYEISRTARGLGVFGLVMALYKAGLFRWLFAVLQPVGQMALTNYLMQSFICATLFYGIGFGLAGQLSRIDVYYIVIVIWIFQIIFSHIWMAYFHFGPMEWLWRSLTYWRRQPFRKRSLEVVPG